MQVLRLLLWLVLGFVKVLCVAYFCLWAYRIRMHAVNEYGFIIHEFDPWFNFRAAQYLAKHGWYSFAHWYDYMSWYPIGRPIGTTTYPGMQIAAVAIWNALKSVPTVKYQVPKEVLAYLPAAASEFLPGKGKLAFGPMSLNDVCCMVPAWFGSLATLFLGLLTMEASGSTSAGVAAAFVMSIIPAHLMRSVAGGYDNESVAVSTFCATFWLWCRAVRCPRSWPFGALAGLAYVSAAATWGGYIFVNNLIGLHAAFLVAAGKYNSGVYRAYTLWYVIGTAGATFVPVIGWTPLKSMEQIGSLLVFLIYQLIEFSDVIRRRSGKTLASPGRFFFFRAAVFVLAGLIAAAVGYLLLQQNYFAPWTARIRGLFLKHEKTGNPLVDSVAEHQASTTAAYKHYLHDARFVAAVGLLFCWHQTTPAKFFPVLYAAVAYHFSLKMSRLMIICGPIVSMLAGFPVGIVVDWCLAQLVGLVCPPRPNNEKTEVSLRTGGMGSIIRTTWSFLRPLVVPGEVRDLIATEQLFAEKLSRTSRLVRAAVAVAILVTGFQHGKKPVLKFVKHCESLAPGMSHPSLVWKSKLQNGEEVLVDDYVAGYNWLKAHTPQDARVMAWWDYGYQITGIGNRTSIADGNTWNHEHIATLGRTLTNPEKKAHNVMRHLADYALVWAGGHGDDMGKSPHLARIANSVFPDVCGESDPTCRKFGFYQDGSPTPMMANSFLYKAVMHKVQPGVELNSKLFKEVYTSKYGLLRIYKVLNVSQESKAWIADPRNRVCDAPGSWYCVGQYPPALKKLIARRRNFAQLEDFNKKGQEKSAYTKLIERTQQGQAVADEL